MRTAANGRPTSLRLGAPGRYALPSLESAEAFPAYLVLLRVGFTMRPPLLEVRCALTAPFHPYLACAGRYVFCCTGRLCALKHKSRTLSGTLPFGVRTFLPLPCGRQRSSGRLLFQFSAVWVWNLTGAGGGGPRFVRYGAEAPSVEMTQLYWLRNWFGNPERCRRV